MAHFHSSEKIPVEMERLKIRQREFDIISEHSRKSLAEILSRSVALDLLSLDSNEKTVELYIFFN